MTTPITTAMQELNTFERQLAKERKIFRRFIAAIFLLGFVILALAYYL